MFDFGLSVAFKLIKFFIYMECGHNAVSVHCITLSVLFQVLKHFSDMRDLITTRAMTSGVICVSQKSILLDGVPRMVNPWYLLNVSTQ